MMPDDNAKEAHHSAQGKDHARIYTVPAGQPFLSALARAILNGDLPQAGGPRPSALDLADITLYMPTRRAARALSNAFLKANGGGTMLLPTIRPISEGQEDLTLLSDAVGLAANSQESLGIAPAVGETERRLALTELVLAWSRAKNPDAPYTPAQAANLAADLAQLMDTVETEGVSLDGLENLSGENLAEHWQETVQFLEIITKIWPLHLAELGVITGAERRNTLILAEAERLRQHPPSSPVIIAGVTGSVPATTELMQAVANFDRGAIVLPAVDLSLDDESWGAIAPKQNAAPHHPEHPQYGFSKLFHQLGIDRNSIRLLPGSELKTEHAARLQFVSEAMRPTRTTAKWHQWVEETNPDDVHAALEGVSLITTPSAQGEAEVIALILREAIETPGRTAALISPDRMLARRVAIRLETWGIRVDDSAGRPFRKTVTGTLLDLVVDCIAKCFAPAETIALLKHPLTRLGLDAFSIRKAARALELIVFRTTYLGKGLDGIEAALNKRLADHQDGIREHRAAQRLWDEDRKSAIDLLARLRKAYTALATLYENQTSQPLRNFIEGHLLVADAITTPPEEELANAETAPLYQGEAGETAAQFFANMLDPTVRAPEIAAHEYADLYRSLIQSENVRPNIPVHPRLSIWGPFEARLQQPDTVILGALNDGTWPDSADPGPWLNRPMRGQLGLPSPEESLGRAAHDFTSLLGASRVYLTRSEKVDGVPTVPSRWLMRIHALLDGLEMQNVLDANQPWLSWARQRDNIDQNRQRSQPPAPMPPVSARPRRISVSGVERWLASPYTIFARNILGLDPLEPIGKAAGASLKGTIIHEALARFAGKHPIQLPDNIAHSLMAEANDILSDYAADTRIRAFWLPRLERFADWFAETEPERRKHLIKSYAEHSGSLTFDAPAGPFKLSARADRIDQVEEPIPGLIITDYKTGTVPSAKKVAGGHSPQLPLEAAIAQYGQFSDIPGEVVVGLSYISASGKNDAGTQTSVAKQDSPVLAEAMLEKFKDLVAKFDNPKTPYTAKRRRNFDYRFDDYAHLARVSEWSSGGDGEDDGGGL